MNSGKCVGNRSGGRPKTRAIGSLKGCLMEKEREFFEVRRIVKMSE